MGADSLPKGSEEAIVGSLYRLRYKEADLVMLSSSVGAITDSDIDTAKTMNGMIWFVSCYILSSS